VLFRYGVVVLAQVAPLEEAALLAQLMPMIGEPFPKADLEEVDVRIGDADIVSSGTIGMSELSVERLQLIAEILARSVALGRYESVVRESFSAIEPWAESLKQNANTTRLQKKLLADLGSTLLIQHSMTGRIEVDDKPELLWERPDLERLYLRLEDEYELQERDAVLERRLALLSSTAEILLNLVNNRHSNRLEIYIIFLIIFEIILSIAGMVMGR
jgi:uncharacterized Rmd1/YagE family protein